MYGDTHVDPAPLFDLGTGRPPPDALEVYCHAPLSLSLFGDALQHAGHEQDLAALHELYAHVGAGAVTDVQRAGGYVHNAAGSREAARLELAGVAHDDVPGEPTMRLHYHVYIGRTAVALETGGRHQVDLRTLRRIVSDLVWPNYINRLRDDVAGVFGVRWAAPAGRHPGAREIVDPPFADHIAGHQLGNCPGNYGELERIVADAESREEMRRMAQQIAADRASGRYTGEWTVGRPVR